jgi:hypothetical protein
VHTALCVGTDPAARKTHPFVDIDQNSVISFLIEIFRRLNAHFTSFCTKNVVNTALCVGTCPAARKSQSFVDFDEKCYFVPDWDISTFKRSFYSILHAERIKHSFMRRNMPRSSQLAIICQFWRKLCYFVRDLDISTSIRSFCSILHAERSAHSFMRRNRPCTSQNASICRY